MIFSFTLIRICKVIAFLIIVYLKLDTPGKEQYDIDGELVCVKPFPSMPIYFGNDPDGAKYRKAYFDKFDGV